MATKNRHLVLKTGLGAAVVAAAAGAYYFLGKDGAKHRKSALVWINRAKKDVLAEIKKLKVVNEKTYNMAAAKVMKKYAKFQKQNPEAYALLVKEFKAHWPKIRKHLPTAEKKLSLPDKKPKNMKKKS
jgi:hypothetical protein